MMSEEDKRPCGNLTYRQGSFAGLDVNAPMTAQRWPGAPTSPLVAAWPIEVPHLQFQIHGSPDGVAAVHLLKVRPTQSLLSPCGTPPPDAKTQWAAFNPASLPFWRALLLARDPQIFSRAMMSQAEGTGRSMQGVSTAHESEHLQPLLLDLLDAQARHVTEPVIGVSWANAQGAFLVAAATKSSVHVFTIRR